MISLIELHFRKDWATIIIWVGMLLVLTLALSIVQMAGSGTIHVQISGIGKLLGLILPLAVMSRGKHGEGKCLSRLPMARYRIFMVQFIYGMLAALVFMLLLRVGLEVIRGVVALSGHDVSPSVLFSSSDWWRDIRGLALTYPIFAFLVALVRWMEKWMNRDHAVALILLGSLALMILLIVIPTLMAFAKVNGFPMGSGWVSGMIDWANRHQNGIVTAIYLVMLIVPLRIYRVRHFKSF